jgi:hypothetical protein
MKGALILIAFAACCGISTLAAQQHHSAVETLLKQGVMEEVRGTNSVTNVLNSVHGGD